MKHIFNATPKDVSAHSYFYLLWGLVPYKVSCILSIKSYRNFRVSNVFLFVTTGKILLNIKFIWYAWIKYKYDGNSGEANGHVIMRELTLESTEKLKFDPL
jgi:hypothetical protein